MRVGLGYHIYGSGCGWSHIHGSCWSCSSCRHCANPASACAAYVFWIWQMLVHVKLCWWDRLVYSWPLRKIELTTCTHQADSLHYVWPKNMADLMICNFRKKFGHTWQRMSLLRPGVINTYTAKPVCWNGWISDSYCSLKPLCSGMGEVVPARTLPTLLHPSPRTVLSLSCFKVLQCINCRDWHCKS